MTSYVDTAFASIDRGDFLPDSQVDYADEDRPLPIGYGQTNSQPSTVKAMLEWLDPQPGHKILDIGSGSGWSSALLGHIVTPRGRVVATEVIPELLEFGRRNCQTYQLDQVTFHYPDDYGSLRSRAPYDRILVSAGLVGKMPKELVHQLKPGGKMVIPINSSVYQLSKTISGEVKTKQHSGYMFVPLIYSQ